METAKTKPEAIVANKPMARVTDRKPNPAGTVIVAEYHHIREGKSSMDRSPADFAKDLEAFYELGFRPVTVSEYLSGKMPLPPGASPVVMTFDDSNPTQFAVLPDGSVDPKSGVGIWMEFAKKHPDFPVHGTFFVLPDTLFAQKSSAKWKVEKLKELGSELGNHTITHTALRKLSDERVKEEIGKAAIAIEGLGEPGPISIAYPLGSTPKNIKLLEGFDLNGKHIVTKAGFLVGANPALPADHPKFSRYRIPRIQANKEPYGLDYWLKKVKAGEVKLFVAP